MRMVEIVIQESSYDFPLIRFLFFDLLIFASTVEFVEDRLERHE